MARPALTAMETALAAGAIGLPAARAKAFDAFAATGMPHRRMEAWKWTDLRAVLPDALPPAADNEVIAPSVFSGVKPFELTVMNGRADWADGVPAGVTIERVEEAPLAATAGNHPLANLCAAFAEGMLSVAIRETVAQPLLIRRIAGAGLTHARASVVLAPGVEATIIESFDGAGAFFSNSLTEFGLGEGALLRRIVLQNAGDDGVETALAIATLGREAALDQTLLSFGGKAARIETLVDLRGQDGRATMKSAFALAGARHADLTSLVRCEATGGAVRQIHKAALRDRSRGVFQGKFLVARGAQKTDAQMNAGAILLSDHSEARAKPELEIYADDVKCSHGSTAGALDEGAVFYMRQRGLSDAAARALLIEAFLGEAIDGVHHAGIEHVLRARLARWLG